MAAFVLANFLGAFLLFQLELVVAKHLLPWYGGSAAVWTTCMMFFQAVLLAGYGLVHGAARRLPLRQTGVWFGLAAIIVALVPAVQWGVWADPFLPPASWRPGAGDPPFAHLLAALLVSAGLPCLLLTTTSPLTQRWFSATHPAVSPYRLYALSNAGSLLGLISYPLVIEPAWPLRTQVRLLAGLFALHVLTLAVCAWQAARAPSAPSVSRTAPRDRVSWPTRLAWVMLATLGSALLLSVTNHLCQDVAVVPFLWALPLVLYLLTFILCFEHDRIYARPLFAALSVLATGATLLVLIRGLEVPMVAQVTVISALLFAACMVCHGELARLKPGPDDLTAFYLAIAVGGALGGLLVSVAAPLLLNAHWEFHLALWAFWTLLPVVWLADPRSLLRRGSVWFPALVVACCIGLAAFLARPSLHPYFFAAAGRLWLPVYVTLALLVAVALCCGLYAASVGRRFHPAHPGWVRAGQVGFWGLVSLLLLLQRDEYLEDVRFACRNFYGVLRVVADDEEDPRLSCLSLQHGRIRHGKQFTAADRRRQPTMYYTEESGVGLVLRRHPAASSGLRVGVIGLGVGTVATYGRTNDAFTFYEINPAVLALNGPGGPFTYLRDAAGRVECVPGDARLALERSPPAGYHALVADAFSGDAIPAHLLTREAVALYLRHLAPDGVLCLHISNRYLDLKPLAAALAREAGLTARRVEVNESDERVAYSSWILLFRPGAAVGDAIAGAGEPLPAPPAGFAVWTDDYSNPVGLLK